MEDIAGKEANKASTMICKLFKNEIARKARKDRIARTALKTRSNRIT
jgi:hypothetical protein